MNNEHIFIPGNLASIQAAKMKELEDSPERLAQLESDLKTLADEIGTDYELHLKPALFPEDLWKYNHDTIATLLLTYSKNSSPI